MSRPSDKPHFVLRRRSSPATVSGGSLLDCGPFTHPSYTSGYQDVQPSFRTPAPQSERQRQSNSWHQGRSTPGNSFSTFRQSRAALSPLSEHSDSDNSFRSSASNTSTPGRSYRRMDIADEPTYSPDPASDVLEKFSRAIRISQRSPEGHYGDKLAARSECVRPSKYNKDLLSHRGQVLDSVNNNAGEKPYMSNNTTKLFEMKNALEYMKKATEGQDDSSLRHHSPVGRNRKNPSPPVGQRRLSRKIRFSNTKDASNKRGCCEKMFSFMITLAAVGFFVTLCVFALRRTMHSACLQNQQLNVTKLAVNLNQRVYGQHIAVDAVPSILRAHIQSDSGSPLVMAFHGWTGIGKNFISQMIAQLIPASSRHLVVIPMSYLPGNDDNLHRQQIQSLIRNGTRRCTFNFFILDEMDKASVPFTEGLLDIVQNLKTKPLNNTKSLILLLSNTGGSGINQFVFNHLQAGHSRESLNSRDLKPVILQALDTAGDPSVELYRTGLVDHIIPFLPLEAAHVKGCIQDYLLQNNTKLPGAEELDELFSQVLGQLSFFPQRTPLFSKTGCRKVPVKVDLALT